MTTSTRFHPATRRSAARRSAARRWATGLAIGSFALLVFAGCDSDVTTTSPSTSAPVATAPATSSSSGSASSGSGSGSSSTEVKVFAACTTTAAYRPKSIIATCGDGEEHLTKITWTSWGSSSATATATLSGVQCDPDCADGSPTSTKGTLTLSGVVSTSSGEVFSIGAFTPDGGGNTQHFQLAPAS